MRNEIDIYISTFPEDIRIILEQIRATIHRADGNRIGL